MRHFDYCLIVVYNVKDIYITVIIGGFMKTKKSTRIFGTVLAVIMALLMLLFFLLPYITNQ